MTKHIKISVAAFIRLQIEASGVPQKDIAAALGYDKPNVITMIKQGRTKLPINKVGPMATALGVDPVHLLRLVMAEYWPGTWKDIQDLVGKSLVTENELAIIEIIRKACDPIDLSLERPAHRAAFIEVVYEIGYEQFKLFLHRRLIPPTVKRA